MLAHFLNRPGLRRRKEAQSSLIRLMIAA